MLVDAGGLVFGTVGGGRVENQAIEFAQRMLADKDSPREPARRMEPAARRRHDLRRRR